MRRRLMLLVFVGLLAGPPAVAGPSVETSGRTLSPDLERRCAALDRRGLRDVVQATPCVPAAVPAERSSAQDPGSCRTTPGTPARCPRRVAAAGSFSGGVWNGALLPDGGAVIYGTDYSRRSGWRIAGLRPDGTTRWAATHNGAGLAAASELVDKARGVIVSGFARTPRTQFVVRRYDTTTGALQWATSPKVPSGGESIGFDMATSGDGRTVIVAGYTHKRFSDARPLIVAFDVRTGQIRWTQTLRAEPGELGVYHLTTSRDGRIVYAAGETWGEDPDPFVVALEAASGRVRWRSRLPGPANRLESIYDIALSADGRSLVIAGEAYLPEYLSSSKLLIGLEAASGEQRWRIGGALPVEGEYGWFDFPVTGPSSVIAVSQAWVGAYAYDPGATVWVRGPDTTAVMAVDPGTGAVLWNSLMSHAPGGMLASARIALDRSGERLYLAGAEARVGGYVAVARAAYGDAEASDLVVHALDAKTGAAVWRSAYNSSPNVPHSLTPGGVQVGRDGVHVFTSVTPLRYAAPAVYTWERSGAWLTYDH
ncbi:MAG TPA: PQQ-binding-like beta-propeller repeat protein [Mycobacteriales bacterium]|nr:PQQ-binding-like beta-propeller repeat protein [Mycobacteriales bacterium]